MLNEQCKCNATPRDKREKHKNQEIKNNSHRGKAMKHTDHENKIDQGHRITPIT